MLRFLPPCLLALTIATVSLGQEAGPSKPLSPEQARKLFQLPPGLRIELVACEPNIESPVAMSFDPAGRLWVVEMLDYPNGPPPGKPGQGRIRILEDQDRDGFFEKSSVFAENLLFANGLLHWTDGVIVTAAPHITWIRDANGDGKADKTEVLYEGFAALNPQLRVSHPILGLDGSVTVSNGLRGGMVVPAGKKAKPISLAGMDFRFDPITGEHEAISGMGQYGNTYDDWGNRFVCDNRHHLRHIVLKNRYLKNNPFVAAPAVVEDISVLEGGPLSSGGKIYPLSKNWTTSNLHEGRFTAACGVFIYRGSLLPKEYHGAAFTCDPTGNLVHVERMKPKGATFEATPMFKEKEFLATTDDWCRPVFLSHGPDDALYMVDMYRAVIEHPEFMPPELKNRPDLTLGKDKGRIWRIVPEKAAKRGEPMSGLSAGELVKRLESKNAWERDVAHRLLLERNDKGLPPALQTLVVKTAEPRAKVKAAWLLEGLSSLDEGLLLSLLKDRHPRVREQGVLIAERRTPSPALMEAVTALAAADDARLRYQVALTLGMWKVDADPEVFASILVRGAEDRWTRLAVATAIPTRAGEVLAALLGDRGYQELAKEQKATLLSDLMAQIGARQDPAEVRGALASLRALKSGDAETLQRTALLGLTTGLERRGGNLPSLLGKVYPKGAEADRGWLDRLMQRAMKTASNPDTPVQERVDAVKLAGHGTLASIRGSLLPLLDATHPTEVRVAALQALGRHRNKEVAAEWVQSWKTFSPSMQRAAVDLLLRSPDTTIALLDGVEKKQVRVAEIEPARARQLLKHPTLTIRERANALLRASLPADRKEIIEKYQAALKLKGDPRKGKLVFAKNCMTCHRIAGEGTDVAPDISDTRTKTAAALLADILNPNQAIDANYIQYLVTTSSGRSLTGILAAETASSITLKRAEGQVDVVLRSDIDSIESTGLSLMPEGLEQSIGVQEMADLLSYLKNWRYLDGSVPLR